ncbi:Alpha-tocopherol transfer protein-like [Zootermopsis nevadensis]|uniref:Alpha-tocopherol transfer protein-like n=2 Tax=Zootermopsis nevadensis TaxID=136037 RepID=A0A067R9Z3_ZOONE|nr:Alpha-tocopherol transfer protein-like [Zootermopsis nevadensis]
MPHSAMMVGSGNKTKTCETTVTDKHLSLDVMEPPSKEVREKVRSVFGLNDKIIKESIQQLKEWLELQPHLPKEIDDARLERWLIRCKNSMEKVKKSLDLYYTVRTTVPEIMTGWDTNADWFKSAKKVCYSAPMPQLTPDCDRVILFGLLTSNTKDFDPLDFCKLHQMGLEIRISEDYCMSEIFIVDLLNYTLAHVTKITIPLIKKFELCGIGGCNVRVKAIHILNAPPFADTLIAMLKVALRAKIVSRIQIHGNNLTTLHEQVPKSCLPTEFGGEAGSIAENWGRWTKKMESYNDMLLEREKHNSDESKRPGESPRSSDLLGFEGSFRKLDVD